MHQFYRKMDGVLTELGDLLTWVVESRLDELPGFHRSLNSLNMQRKMGSKGCVCLILFFSSILFIFSSL